jgi:DNA-binding response OmpR family regulator
LLQLEQMASGTFADAVSLVLLDLRLPRLHGMELLCRASELGLTRARPFVVFTSSDNPAERAQALDLGARDYLVKPLGFRPLQNLLNVLYDRWIAPMARLD